MMSPNTTNTGDVNGITVQYTENIAGEDNNNNNYHNVDDNSGPFSFNINPKDQLLRTNIDPTDPTVDDLVTMNNILYIIYKVDENQHYSSDYFNYYDYS